MSDEIRITAEPLDDQRCRFDVSRPVYPSGVRRFGSAADAQGSPLAEAIFAVAGVTEIIVSERTVTVAKQTAAPWPVVGKQVGAAIRAGLSGGAPPVAPEVRRTDPAQDDTLYERVAEIFATRVNPMVAQHGGRVDLIDVQDSTVLLRLAGGCQGCGMADVTLRQGIEALLRDSVPEVAAIVDITDHAAGTDPYFAASKK
ncbi:MAG: NifU family protein [Gemmatimonadetes bacterium]|nr:NifU family protein [Gemmatimonadota bacterium]